ncbi:MAG: hypothetical protein IPH88_14350 [Bacteroidales bacterium]|nr:hypothetical protein [Bacteroidales bacterium]
MRKILTYGLLLILPLLFLLLGLGFHRANYSADPEYAYLLNGLNVARFKHTGHYDHPGSTTQMWNAAILRVTHLVAQVEDDDLTADVLKNPDYYIGILISSGIWLNALLFILLGFLAYKLLKDILSALFLQAAPFLSSSIPEQVWTKLSPEPMLVVATSLFIICLLFYITSEHRKNFKFPVLLALAVGFGLATKVTFAPIAILGFLVISGFRNKIIYSISVIPAFVLFTMPAWAAYKLMFRWFLGLGTHTGVYGQGKSGFLDPTEYIHNLGTIVSRNIFFSVTIAALFLVSVTVLILKSVKKTSADKSLNWYIASVMIAQISGILLIAKHYHMNYYLLPVLSLSGLGWLFIWMKIRPLEGSSSFLPKLIGILLLCGMLVSAWSNKAPLKLADYYYDQTNIEYDSVKNLVKEKYAGYTVIDYYPYSIDKMNALRWGNVYSRQLYTENIAKIYPDQLFYDVYAGSFFNWDKPIAASDMLKKYGNKLIITGGQINEVFMKSITDKGLRLEPLMIGRTQAIYLVDSTSSFFRQSDESSALSKYCFSMDSLSADKQFFVAGNEKIPVEGKRNDKEAYSGKCSAMLSATDVYAIPYRITNVKEGEKYMLTVWKKGDLKETYLVAAADNAGQFYLQSTDPIEDAGNGWVKVGFTFTVPANLSTPAIKVYVWNNSGKPVYFDDLCISRIK